eukprot:12158168-Alexandrium_andersonii.AAC.1
MLELAYSRCQLLARAARPGQQLPAAELVGTKRARAEILKEGFGRGFGHPARREPGGIRLPDPRGQSAGA